MITKLSKFKLLMTINPETLRYARGGGDSAYQRGGDARRLA